MWPELLAAAVTLTAPQQVAPPEFRADVRVIRVDVSVVDGSGRAVAGLGLEDFEVREDGRPVELSYFEAVSRGGIRGIAPGDVVTAATHVPARRVVILVDTTPLTPAQLRRAQRSVADFVRDADRADWLQIVNLGTGRGVGGWVDEEREHLAAAALRLRRGGAFWGDPVEDLAIQERVEIASADASESWTGGRFLSVFARSAGLIGDLEALLVQLSALEGRKAVVLVSPGFPQLRDLDDRLERVASLAREAAAAVYYVDVSALDGLLPAPGERMRPVFEMLWARSGGAQDLAEATGGFTYRLNNNLIPALDQVADEMGTYYVLGYTPSRPDDGRFRRVEVKVLAKGLRARTKKGYIAGPRQGF
jgi:VWFA-related protein